MEQNTNIGTELLGVTAGLWLMQKMFWLGGVLTLANWASVATILSATCASVYYIYMIIKNKKK